MTDPARFPGHPVILALLVAGALAGLPAVADDSKQRPAVALIIDDLGQRSADGQRVAALPGPVACAFLPWLPHVEQTAERCHASGKEVILHQPLQAGVDDRLGPGGITMDMDRDEVVRTVADNLDAIPHVSGMNSHMGSLLTRHPGHMTWVIQSLHRHQPDSFFIDSVTTTGSIARRIAAETGLRHGQRDVFIDPEPDPAVIETQFGVWLEHARRYGIAIAIAHPYEETLGFLERELPRLEEEHGVTLIPVHQAIKQQTEVSWPVYSSP